MFKILHHLRFLKELTLKRTATKAANRNTITVSRNDAIIIFIGFLNELKKQQAHHCGRCQKK